MSESQDGSEDTISDYEDSKTSTETPADTSDEDAPMDRTNNKTFMRKSRQNDFEGIFQFLNWYMSNTFALFKYYIVSANNLEK